MAKKYRKCPKCNEDLILKISLKRQARLKRWVCPKCDWNNPKETSWPVLPSENSNLMGILWELIELPKKDRIMQKISYYKNGDLIDYQPRIYQALYALQAYVDREVDRRYGAKRLGKEEINKVLELYFKAEGGKIKGPFDQLARAIFNAQGQKNMQEEKGAQGSWV